MKRRAPDVDDPERQALVAAPEDFGPLFVRGETDDDRERQRRIERRLAAAWACVIQSLPDLSVVDCLCVREGKVVAVCEVKYRLLSVRRRTFPNIWVEEAKRLGLIALAATYHLPPQAALFVVHAASDDALYYIPADVATASPLEMRERTAPRASGLTLPSDRACVRLVPIDRWRLLREMRT